MHKAGFVSIIGRPNAGKSTLVNALMGEKVSAVTYKAQTTRHRIFAIYNTDEEQIVISDTPGLVSESSYELHRQMIRYVRESLEDADLLLLMIDAAKPFEDQDPLWALAERCEAPLHVLLNKADLLDSKPLAELLVRIKARFATAAGVHTITALEGRGVPELLTLLREAMPEHPAYFDKEILSDRSERFFASEILREKIFLNYREEIPYASEAVIENFKDEEDILRIRAEILVERPTQKSIIIGKGGEAIKKTATEARIEMETFFGKKVFLETYVRVKPDWRNQKRMLAQLGYM